MYGRGNTTTLRSIDQLIDGSCRIGIDEKAVMQQGVSIDAVAERALLEKTRGRHDG